MEKIITGLLTALLVFVLLAVIFAIIGLIFAIPVMFLWNWLMPNIFGLGEIGYFQAWGIFWLSALLFKGSSTTNNE